MINDLLKDKTKSLEWFEPQAGLYGNREVTAHITLSATIQDCINMQRHIQGQRERGNVDSSDEDLLAEFIAVHWAQLKK